MQEDDIRALLRDAPEAGCRALFDTYWKYAYTVIFRILQGSVSREDIEECTADVLGDVMLHFQVASQGSLKAYIGTAAKRRAIDRLRSVSRHAGDVSLDSDTAPELTSGEDVAAAAEASEQSERVLAAVKALGEPDASIVIYKYYYDMNSVQIGKWLGLNPVTVRSRCNRAMKRLRAALADLE
ncbi:MAG: sigma-70 family RNA polymerase sigma factor [Oscillospiraceae bacterium]|nr:sigma-70 family RNA polymerase sigma factor [Oscillospiraceae bacterium]